MSKAEVEREGGLGVNTQAFQVAQWVKNLPGEKKKKESVWNAGDMGSVPGSRRSPGTGHGNPLQDSCLENPMDPGACWATVQRVAKSRT